MRINWIQELIDILRGKVLGMGILVCKKLAYDNKDKTKIHTLIFGSSHLESGYRPIPGEFNFATSSQDLYYSYNLYKKYNTENVKNIIISFSDFTPGHILQRTGFSKYCVLHKLIFGIPYQDEELAHKQRFGLYEKLYKNHINKYVRKLKKDLSSYWGELPSYYQDKFDETTLKNKALAQFKNNSRENNQMDYCRKLIKETKENNQNLIFVMTPFREEHRKYLPEKEVIFKKLYQCCEGFEHIHVLNFYDNSNFEPSDFWDSHHLNLKGAEKLTEMIRQKIKS